MTNLSDDLANCINQVLKCLASVDGKKSTATSIAGEVKRLGLFSDEDDASVFERVLWPAPEATLSHYLDRTSGFSATLIQQQSDLPSSSYTPEPLRSDGRLATPGPPLMTRRERSISASAPFDL